MKSDYFAFLLGISCLCGALPTVAEPVPLLNYDAVWKYDQSGADLNTAWRDPGFDDSSWPSGPGVFGFPTNENLLGAATIQTVLSRYISGGSGPQPVTYYFRTVFSFDHPLQNVILTASNLLDDGAVFYLNGVEVGRAGMLAGETTFQTLSFRGDDIRNRGVDILTFASNSLMRGENLLAVELHQGSSFSGDAIFGMALWAELPPPGPVQILRQPTNQTRFMGESASFEVDVTGSPPYSFQWFRDGEPVSGATNQLYVITGLGFEHSGEYSVLVSNSFGMTTSGNASLLVRHSPIEVVGFADAWKYTIDEPIGWNQPDYDDSTWPSGMAALGNGSDPLPIPIRTVLPLSRADGSSIITYYFRRTFVWTNQIEGVRMLATNLIDDGAVFYLNGARVHSVGMPGGPVLAPTLANQTVVTAQFSAFEEPLVSLVPGTNILAAEVHQVHPASLDIAFAWQVSLLRPTPGPLRITHHPLSIGLSEGSRHEFFVAVDGSPPYSYQWFKDGLPIPNTSNPTLVLPPITPEDDGIYTVVVSNAFDSVESEPASLTVIPFEFPFLAASRTDSWKYHAQGIDLGTAWKEVTFDDTQWPQGMGPFEAVFGGNGNLPATDHAGARIHTYYFRRKFTIPEGVPPFSLVWSNRIRDGAIFYLNGSEVGRLRMPKGLVTYNTLASAIPASNFAYDFLVARDAMIVPGENLLAVEVHQAFTNSTFVRLESMAGMIGEFHIPPRITANPVVQHLPLGFPAEFSVEAKGTPPLHFQWFKEAVSIDGATNSSFFIPEVVLSDEGNYSVAVSNMFGIVNSDPAALTVGPEISPPSLIAGPYLQTLTATGVTICWATDALSDSRVSYGFEAGSLSLSMEKNKATTNHFIALTNLRPNTRYYYSVGTLSSNMAGGEDFCFITAPADTQPIRIWAIGDSGTGTADAQAVAAAYAEFAAGAHTDVWLMLGDNAYFSGTYSEYLTRMFQFYPELLRKTALWPTIGNHEIYSANAAGHFAYLDIFALPAGGEAGGVASGTERYYSFDYGNVHFVCLDSETSSFDTNGAMLSWLREDLAANSKDWLIAFWHQPPYSHGSHNSDNHSDGNMVRLRQTVVPILDAYGVDLVLCGHSHNYERSYLIDGHYGYSWQLLPQMIKNAGSGRPSETGAYSKASVGPAPHEGAVYVVAGSSGWATGIGNLDHPAMFYSVHALGSMVIDIDQHRLDAKFLRETGEIADHFTILKGVSPGPLRVYAFQFASGQAVLQWTSTRGSQYRVEASQALVPRNWAPVSSVITAATGITVWTNQLQVWPERLFFRVVEVSE